MPKLSDIGTSFGSSNLNPTFRKINLGDHTSTNIPHIINRATNDAWGYAFYMKNGFIIPVESIEAAYQLDNHIFLDVTIQDSIDSQVFRNLPNVYKLYVPPSKDRSKMTLNLSEISFMAEVFDS